MAIAVVSLALVAWHLLPHDIAIEDANQIRVGMTRAKVRHILGAPSFKQLRRNELWVYRQDIFGSSGFYVEFGDDGLVVDTWF